MRCSAIASKVSKHRVGRSREIQSPSLLRTVLVEVFKPFCYVVDWPPWPIFKTLFVSVCRSDRSLSMRNICPKHLNLFESSVSSTSVTT